MDNKKTGSIEQLEGYLEAANKKLPALPESVKSFIVSVSPWLIVIAAVISLPALFAIIGVGSYLNQIAYFDTAYRGSTYYITWVLTLASFILEIAAVKGLIGKKLSAWRLMFYATLVSLLSSLISLQIASFIIVGAISFYILFQIKSYYTN